MNVRLLKCPSCGVFQSPPAYLCLSCKSEGLEEAEVHGKGKIYTYSTVYIPLATLEKEAPYTLAIVEIECGCKITGRVIMPSEKSSQDKLSIGAPVEVAEVRDGVYFFKLVDGNDTDGLPL
ncbi:MAG: transcriptional regulator [Candidatus Dadabacteria bacterium]